MRVAPLGHADFRVGIAVTKGCVYAEVAAIAENIALQAVFERIGVAAKRTVGRNAKIQRFIYGTQAVFGRCDRHNLCIFHRAPGMVHAKPVHGVRVGGIYDGFHTAVL